ncbi:tetratricopeptide repeat protein [Sphingoaurantiacus capsulatus]|uniref:Tetratricopeptide repeat protein n=1 Tax=Sphingoaurantiacus capsulatus TaxID=1771310 RepID=A0ABV7X6B3_9SPHN
MLKTSLTAALLASALAIAAPAAAQPTGDSPQGTSLLGQPLITYANRNANVAPVETLARAARDAKAAFDAGMTADNATWYGRILFYQGYTKESLAVYDAALKRFPNSAKLLRHRAHRLFSLRQFDASIEAGLKADKLYQGQPLEREKPGPDYFKGDPDIVQFYLYYHLGQAYFAKRDYANAAKYFTKSGETSMFDRDLSNETASTYWRYLSLARGGNMIEAQKLIDGYDVRLFHLHPTGGSDVYFDAIQLFKGNRAANTFFSNTDSGRAFATADATAASTSYSLANYHLLMGNRDEAKQWLKRAMSVDAWSFFARIQAEADWVALFPGEKP